MHSPCAETPPARAVADGGTPARRGGKEARVDVTDAAPSPPGPAAEHAAPLDLMIANAGIWAVSAGAGETLAEVERVMRVNFAGTCNAI